MERSNAYWVGWALGKIPWPLYAAAGALLVIYALWQQPATPAAPPAATPDALREKTPTALCARERAERLEQYAAHMAAGQPWQAANTIRRCATLLADAELQDLSDKAEQASWLATAKNDKESARNRIAALDKLRVAQGAAADPSLKAIHDKLVAQLKREREAELKAEAARKKREGVTLGMTPEEVIASSWGKPHRVNRSVYSFGVHEQWVYHGSNYLYFRNGVLDSVQTGQ